MENHSTILGTERQTDKGLASQKLRDNKEAAVTETRKGSPGSPESGPTPSSLIHPPQGSWNTGYCCWMVALNRTSPCAHTQTL